MFGFLIKKNFCDGWDNLVSVLMVNSIFLVINFGLFFLITKFAANTPLLLLFIVIACVIDSILVFAYGDSAADIANFKGIHLVDYFKAFPKIIKDASLFGIMIAAIIIVSAIAIEYYLFNENNASYFNLFLGAMVIWIDIFLILALQWFVPIRSLMHNDFKKVLKKCMIMFFDNTGFSVAIGIYSLVFVILSVFCIGFLPSVAGILIATTNAMRLRLYKYDYLEEHPELKTKKERNQIPWEELIYEDRETLGPRKLKSFLFPWKD